MAMQQQHSSSGQRRSLPTAGPTQSVRMGLTACCHPHLCCSRYATSTCYIEAVSGQAHMLLCCAFQGGLEGVDCPMQQQQQQHVCVIDRLDSSMC